MTSRKNTIRGAGHVWHTGADWWETELSDRVKAVTWKFGSIHQCKVLIKYDGAHPLFGEQVGICLAAQPTRIAAMVHGVEWAEKYINNGPPTVEQVFADCYDHWPTLYGTRIDVISHLFFTNGNGYEWLDGAIQSTNPDDWIESRRRDEYKKSHPTADDIRQKSLFQRMWDEHLKKPYLDEDGVSCCKRILGLLVDKEKLVRPLPDDGNLKDFYPISENFAEIMRVPNDVRPDWLALSYEAALLLRDRSKPDDPKAKGTWREGLGSNNIKIGTRIVKELEKRFPQLAGE